MNDVIVKLLYSDQRAEVNAESTQMVSIVFLGWIVAALAWIGKKRTTICQ